MTQTEREIEARIEDLKRRYVAGEISTAEARLEDWLLHRALCRLRGY